MTLTQTMTVTSESVEDRLSPKLTTFPTQMNTRRLLRSSSFNMLRQFPAYLCRGSSSQDLLDWLYNYRTKLSTYFTLVHKQGHRLLLITSIWSCLILIGVQVAWCLAMLLSSFTMSNLPLGMIFMVTCIAVMGALVANLVLVRPPVKPSWRRLREEKLKRLLERQKQD